MKLVIPFQIDRTIAKWMRLAAPREVAWLGTLSLRGKDTLVVEEVFLPKQRIFSASVDLDKDAVFELNQKCREEGKELRWHGHSHVNMAVSPSGTDEAEFQNNVRDADWFVASILNLKGECSTRLGAVVRPFGQGGPVLVHAMALSTDVEYEEAAGWADAVKAQFEEATKAPEPVYGGVWRGEGWSGKDWRGESWGDEWQERLAQLRQRAAAEEPGAQVIERAPEQPAFFEESRAVQAALELQRPELDLTKMSPARLRQLELQDLKARLRQAKKRR